jgi:hypothetical protein
MDRTDRQKAARKKPTRFARATAVSQAHGSHDESAEHEKEIDPKDAGVERDGQDTGPVGYFASDPVM